MRRMFFAMSLIPACACVAGAQIIRSPRSDPPVIVHAAVALLQIETIFDGSSGSAWDFGSALQYRISVEKRIGAGSSLGVAVTRASVPLRYNPLPVITPTGLSCTDPGAGSCDASASLTTIALNFTGGGSQGFHQILNLGAGVSIFDDFEEDGTGKSLAPIDGDKDFYLAVGFGVGFGLSDHFAVSLVQDAGVVLHQRTGLSGNRDSFRQLLATRLGFRFAFGR
jgi:hypothetical protein